LRFLKMTVFLLPASSLLAATAQAERKRRWSL
jgi:hypothetical protein